MVVALTGGIASGKSEVLKFFKIYGAHTEDTDSIVHEIYKKDKEVHRELLNRWGKMVFHGSLPDRKAIAKLVFNNKHELQWLNELMHPRVKNKITAKRDQELSIIAVPLLYEVNWQSEFDTVIAVWCSETSQQKRLTSRGWSKAESASRLSAQIHQDEKISRADHGIINDWSLKSLNRQCRSIYNMIHKDTQAYG